MLQATLPDKILLSKQKRRRRRIKFPHICADALALGVSRVHLWYVLSGKRVSQRLITAYDQLKRGTER